MLSRYPTFSPKRKGSTFVQRATVRYPTLSNLFLACRSGRVQRFPEQPLEFSPFPTSPLFAEANRFNIIQSNVSILRSFQTPGLFAEAVGPDIFPESNGSISFTLSNLSRACRSERVQRFPEQRPGSEAGLLKDLFSCQVDRRFHHRYLLTRR